MKLRVLYVVAFFLAAFVSNRTNAQVKIFDPSMTIVSWGTINSPEGESIEMIIDGKLSTKFLSFNSNVDETGFDVDLGGSVAMANRLDITTGGDAPERDALTLTISGSNDGEAWVEIATVTLDCNLPRTFTSSVEFENTNTYGHYRIHFASKCNEAEALFQVAEIQLYDTTQEPPATMKIFTPNMSVTPFGETVKWGANDYPESPDKAIDGNVDTKFFNFEGSNGTGFTVDLGGVSAVATGLELVTANDSPERDPASYEVYGSNDNVNFILIGSGGVACQDERFFESSYYLDNSTAYSYYRINFPSLCGVDQSLFQIAEAQLIHNGEITSEPDNNVFFEGITFIAGESNDSPAGEGIERVFDGLVSTKWLNFKGNDGSEFTADLGGNPSIAVELRITTANDSPERDPSSYLVYGSNDNENFVELGAGEIPCDDRRHFTRSFPLDNYTAYAYYRVSFPDLCGGADQTLFQVAEVNLYSAAPGEVGPQNRMAIFDPSMSVVRSGTYGDVFNGEEVENVIDGLISTKYLNNNGNVDGTAFDVYLGGVTAVANKIEVTTGGDEPNRDGSSVMISGSLDGETWVEVATVALECNLPRLYASAVEFENSTAFGYYRIHFVAKCDEANTLFQVTEVQLYDTNQDDPVNYNIFTKTMSAWPYGESVNWAGDIYPESPDKAFDGSSETKFFNSEGANGSGFTVDLENISATAVGLRLVTANDAPERDPSSYEVFGSNDNETFTLIGSGEIACQDERFYETSYELENSTAYRFYRINFPTLCGADQPLFQIAEAQLIHDGTINELSDNKILNGDATFTDWDTNDSPAGESTAFSFDGLVTTKWLNFNGNLGSGLSFNVKGGAAAVSKFRITTANDSPQRDPASFEILGSNDNETFVKVAGGDIPCDPRRHLTRFFELNNEKVYAYYKISFPNLCGADQNLFQIAEVNLYHDGNIVSIPEFNVTFNVTEGDNVPVEGASIDFNGASMTTDAEGKAIFGNVSATTEAAFQINESDFDEYSGTVTVVDEDVSVAVSITKVGVDERNLSNFSLFPNPTQGLLNLQVNHTFNKGFVRISNSLGAVLLVSPLSQMSSSYDVSSYSPGLYLIQVSTDSEQISKTFMVN